MKVSIIIPVYNAEQFLDECINSALNQTYDNIEIIAVNDGSTDNSKNILEKFNSKIKIIHKINGGTASALNAGIKEMNSEWFKWLSADDILKRNCIDALIKETKQFGESAKNHIFYSNYEFIDEKSKIIGKYIKENYNDLDNFDRNVILLDHFFGSGNTVLIHKSVFEKCGMFDEHIGYQEDYEFWLRCCLLFNVQLFFVSDTLAQYRIHTSQLTQKNLTQNISHANIIRNLILEKLEPDIKLKYIDALNKFQKQKPLKTKIRRKLRDIMFKTMSKTTSEKILRMYLSRKRN